MHVPRPGLFLDRDGVVNLDRGYVYRREDFHFLPGIFSLCRKARAAGYGIVIVTNQSGIARGYYSPADFRELSDWVIAQFRWQGAGIDGIVHCPHHPGIDGPCWCRKPRPGMLVKASRRYRLDRRRSIMIGDKDSDTEAARRAGIGTVVKIAPRAKFPARLRARADHLVTSLYQVERLL